jgi:hypothetical protein
MEKGGGACHTVPMTNDTHPYTLDIIPGRKPGFFDWAIRRNGKLIQRSDRPQASEEDARKNGLKEIERQFASGHNQR